jgi:hypothetical protein
LVISVTTTGPRYFPKGFLRWVPDGITFLGKRVGGVNGSKLVRVSDEDSTARGDDWDGLVTWVKDWVNVGFLDPGDGLAKELDSNRPSPVIFEI